MNSTVTSRIEELLKAILGVEAKLEPPQSRIEVCKGIRRHEMST